MLFLAMGDAFRTGTHKAIIFDWLQLEGRGNESTKVYGYTRSWSQIGSATSVVAASALVWYHGDYSNIFWFSTIPYLINIINFLGYPAMLDGNRKRELSIKSVIQLLGQALQQAVHQKQLRQLIVESMSFEGGFKASKDYLQPILKNAVIALPFLLVMENIKRTALLIGIVYFAMHMMSSIASPVKLTS
ncbi:MAG: hypothetical protein VCF25_15590 [Candidatus Poribacteria bacterium]